MRFLVICTFYSVSYRTYISFSLLLVARYPYYKTRAPCFYSIVLHLLFSYTRTFRFVFLLKASKQSQMWGHGNSISIRGEWRAGWWVGRQLNAHVSSSNSSTYTKIQFAASYYYILQLVTLKLFYSAISLRFSFFTSPLSVEYLHPLLHWNCINIWKHDFITTYRDILFPLLRFSSTYSSMIT